MREGDELTWQRRVSVAEVDAFAELVGDHAAHHRPVGDRPLVVHGLLMLGFISQLSARFDYIGRELTASFLRPCFTGELLTGRMRVQRVTPVGDLGWEVELRGEVVNEHRRRVLVATGRGLSPYPTSDDQSRGRAR
ncbi:MaoC family dehydratase [Allocatelliglobosispora scoriae]|uniref:MaoC family dehydratase n=1 Tax=Allocatelliglobosispora scoriae TaxID=643052 RepID=UPI0016194A5D|nr:hypothetical protein [Allocatelliglobosispora scoriae]